MSGSAQKGLSPGQVHQETGPVQASSGGQQVVVTGGTVVAGTAAHAPGSPPPAVHASTPAASSLAPFVPPPCSPSLFDASLDSDLDKSSVEGEVPPPTAAPTAASATGFGSVASHAVTVPATADYSGLPDPLGRLGFADAPVLPATSSTDPAFGNYCPPRNGGVASSRPRPASTQSRPASTQTRSTARTGFAPTSSVSTPSASTPSASTNDQASSRPPRTASALVTPLSAVSSGRGFAGGAGTAGTTVRTNGTSGEAASPSLGSTSTSATRSTAELSNRPARTIRLPIKLAERITEPCDRMTESIYPATEVKDAVQTSRASSATSTTCLPTATVLRLRGGSDAGAGSSDDEHSDAGPIETFGDAGMIDIAACPLGFDLDTDEPMPESTSAGLASDPMSRSGLTTPGDEDDDDRTGSAGPRRTGGRPRGKSVPDYLVPFLRKRAVNKPQAGRRNAYGFWFNESRQRSAIARDEPMELDGDSIVQTVLSMIRLDQLSSWFMREAVTRAPHLGSSHVQVENLDTCLRFPMPPNLAFLFQRLADSAAALVGGAVAVCVADNAKTYLRVAAADAVRPFLSAFLLRVLELMREQVERGSARPFAYEWDRMDFKDFGKTNENMDKLADALAISYSEDDLIGLRRSLTNPLFIQRLNATEFAALERASRESHAEVGQTVAEEKLARIEQECRDLRDELDRLQAALVRRDDEIALLRTKALKKKPVFADVGRSSSANEETSSPVASAQQQGSKRTTAQQRGGEVAISEPAQSEARPPRGVDGRLNFTPDSPLEEQWMSLWHGRPLAESLRLQVSPPQSLATSPPAGKDEAGKDVAGKDEAGKEEGGKEEGGKEEGGKEEGGKDEAAMKAGFFGITSVGVGVMEEGHPGPDVLYRSNLDDAYYASKETIGGRTAGFVLCRQFPTAPGFTFASLLADLFPRVGSIFVSVFTIGPHLLSILTSRSALEWASQCGVSLAFHARQSDAPRLLTSLEHANRYITSHLDSNSNLDETERARPRLTMVQIMMAGNGAHHAKELIAATRDGTSLVVWEGSANPSRQGFGGDGLDDAGLAPSFTSYETGTLSFVPACSATAASILAEHDNFMAFLTERGLLLRATRSSCMDIAAVPAVAEARRKEREALMSADMRALHRGVEKAEAAARLERQKLFERIPSSQNVRPYDPSIGLNLGRGASLSGLGIGTPSSLLAAELRGLLLAENSDGEPVAQIGLTAGSWDAAQPGTHRKVYACCYRCHRFATGTSPTGFSGWRATHPNPVGACPQHIRSSTGCLYEGSEVDSASDGRAFSIEERDAELVKRIKLLQTCRFSHAETGLVIYDPVTVWYLRLPDHLYGYQAIAESLSAFRDTMHTEHPMRDIFTSMVEGVGSEKGPVHLSKTLISRLSPVLTFHSENETSPAIEAGRANEVLDYLYPVTITSEVEEHS